LFYIFRPVSLTFVTVDVKIQQAMTRALATADDVNTAGNETSRLVDSVGHVIAEWSTWLDRAAAAQRTIDEMTSRAEMTSSLALDMRDILADFDARSRGSIYLLVVVLLGHVASRPVVGSRLP